MRVAHLLFVTTLVTASPTFAQMSAAPKEALDGIDPVALLTQGKEISGKPELKVSRGQFDYWFASAENKATFERTPEKYEIQMSGACARMGGGVTGNPADYAVVDGKIYIFGSDDCHKKFVAAPARFLPRPVPPMPAKAADLQAGRALIDRAVAAIGGAEKLDAVSTCVDSASQVQKRPQGDATITVKTYRRFPGDVRVERTTVMGERTSQSANVLNKDGAWFIGMGRAFPQTAEGRMLSEAEYGRNLISILRARRNPDFMAAALPSATIDGVSVDRVRVKHGPLDVTLSLDKTSGRVHALTYTGRNMEAEIGESTILYGDYRETNGLQLPFTERGLFNGQPEPFMSRTIDSIAVNPALDAALFQPPAGGGL